MPTLVSLKKDLEFNKELSGILEALKAIAVNQFHIWQRRMLVFQEFHQVVEEFFSLIDPRGLKHPFINPKDRSCLVVGITSDTGLLGGLNLQVVNACVNELAKTSGVLVILGEKGKIYLEGMGIPCVSFPGVVEEERIIQATRLKFFLLNNILKGKVGGLKVIYPRAYSITVQRIEMLELLPYNLEGKKLEDEKVLQELIEESAIEDVITYLVDLWVGRKLYEIMGFSKLAEFAARVIHLEESSQKLKEIDKKTRLKYFKVRHELIDRSMRELFAARALYS